MKIAQIVLARRAMLLAPMLAALGGCMTSTPIWDAHFGEAVRAVKQAQIIDPHAAEHAPSVSGVDGKAAASAMDSYDKSFRQPAPVTNPYVIGVSGGGSSGQ
ncbi:hypothetical protein [Paraburkholderia sp. SIMBA_054]|uniref:hypothetical protein n=1 Tax=Paraburkholderia TaxID=1822464 RepID=UPI00397ABB9E